MSRIVVCTIILLMVSACAKEADEVSAVEAPRDAYSTLSCSDLKNEKILLSQKVENLSAEQNSAASNDALGVFLLGLPLASMSGGDKEAELASAKGQLQAIDRRISEKKCL